MTQIGKRKAFNKAKPYSLRVHIYTVIPKYKKGLL